MKHIRLSYLIIFSLWLILVILVNAPSREGKITVRCSYTSGGIGDLENGGDIQNRYFSCTDQLEDGDPVNNWEYSYRYYKKGDKYICDYYIDGVVVKSITTDRNITEGKESKQIYKHLEQLGGWNIGYYNTSDPELHDNEIINVFLLLLFIPLFLLIIVIEGICFIRRLKKKKNEVQKD